MLLVINVKLLLDEKMKNMDEEGCDLMWKVKPRP